MAEDRAEVQQAVNEFNQGSDAQQVAAEKRLDAMGEGDKSPRRQAAARRKAAKEKAAGEAQAKRSAPEGRHSAQSHKG